MEREGETSLTPDVSAPCPYPYGLRLHLTQEELEKLGYGELPPAGTQLKVEAVGCVTRSASEDPDADGDVDYCCVEVQIKALGIEEEGVPQEYRDEEHQAGRAHRMYGKGKQPT